MIRSRTLKCILLQIQYGRGAVLPFLISYIIFFQQPLLRLADDGVSCLIWHMVFAHPELQFIRSFQVPRYARVPDFRERRNSSAIEAVVGSFVRNFLQKQPPPGTEILSPPRLIAQPPSNRSYTVSNYQPSCHL